MSCTQNISRTNCFLLPSLLTRSIMYDNVPLISYPVSILAPRLSKAAEKSEWALYSPTQSSSHFMSNGELRQNHNDLQRPTQSVFSISFTISPPFVSFIQYIPTILACKMIHKHLKHISPQGLHLLFLLPGILPLTLHSSSYSFTCLDKCYLLSKAYHDHPI